MSQAKRLKTSKITTFFKSCQETDEDRPSTSQLEDEQRTPSGDGGDMEDAPVEKTPHDGNQATESEWMSPNHPAPSSIPPKERQKQKIYLYIYIYISGKKDEARRSFDFPAFIRAFGPWPLSRSIT